MQQSHKNKKQQAQRKEQTASKNAATSAKPASVKPVAATQAASANSVKPVAATQTASAKPASVKPVVAAKPASAKPTGYLGRLEWIGALASPVLLLCSWVVLFFTGVTKLVTIHMQEFYYKHLRRGAHRIAGVCESIRASRIQTITMFTVLGLVIPMMCTMRTGIAVSVDGTALGYVREESLVDNARREIERSTAAITGQPYTLDADISYRLATVIKDRFIPAEELATTIASNAKDLSTLALLKIDGEIVGACASVDTVQTALDAVQAPYLADADASAEARFLENISVETVQAPVSMLVSGDTLYNTLIQTTTQPQYYEVDDDDTLTSIARSYGMYLEDLISLNPDVIPERMPPGLEVLVHAAEPRLSVEVVQEIDYTEDIPYDTIRQKDSSLFEDKVRIIQEGVPGEAAISAKVTTINGQETDMEILSRVVLSDATDKIINVGTKVSGVGSGRLQNPVPGAPITSGYKYRWGRMHKGIDLGVSTGTPVQAADSGKVIVSTYSQSGYGYYIIIDHGNGMKTLYGHNSRLIAEVGSTVQKGQVIAYSGSTGNSTGPHCHFEVLVDNSNVNPAGYIS